MVEFPTDEVEQRSTKKATFLDVIFGLMVLTATGFSTYTTFVGYSYDFPGVLSVAIAVIVGLGLLGTNYAIRQNRIDSTGVGRPFLFFLLVFLFSFISNTNAIYTYFLKNDIVGQTQETAWSVFDLGTVEVISAIDNFPLVNNERENNRKIEIERKNLYTQITDPNNPGMGEEAQRHLQVINTLLEEPLTPLRAPIATASEKDMKDYADRLDSFIAEQYSKQVSNSSVGAINAFSQHIKSLRNLYEKQVVTKEYSSDTTDMMKRDLDQINFKAGELIGFTTTLEPINNTSDQIGSFQYTWSNFSNFINPAAILLSILLGAMLDLLTPLMSILLFKPDVKF